MNCKGKQKGVLEYVIEASPPEGSEHFDPALHGVTASDVREDLKDLNFKHRCSPYVALAALQKKGLVVNTIYHRGRQSVWISTESYLRCGGR